jgi:hypothetical protein
MPKLTKRLVDAVKHPASGQAFVRDNELRGFALRITPGSKTFVLEKEINGRVRRLSLGRSLWNRRAISPKFGSAKLPRTAIPLRSAARAGTLPHSMTSCKCI